ncbi:MAG: HmuY family protein [Flavobacteriales bacterium]
MRIRPIGGLLLAPVLFTACLKEELPVPKRTASDTVMEGVACIGSSYADQVWYDIRTNRIVSTNSKMDWDLAFESGADGWHVRLNGSRFMRATPTGRADITGAVDTTGYGPRWRIDRPSGVADSTAFGDWRTDHGVYAIDMGYNVNSLPMPARQVRIVSVDASSYTIETALLNGNNVQRYTVLKDPARRYVHFSLLNGRTAEVAPPDGDYDLVFTQFTTQFFDPYMAYLVTGAVNGFSGIRVARLTAADFSAVTLSDTLQHRFSTAEDAIGYDWKDYNFDASLYKVNTALTYIIQDTEGYFYKLHFVDFYNEQGQRGCPRFEVVAL